MPSSLFLLVLTSSFYLSVFFSLFTYISLPILSPCCFPLFSYFAQPFFPLFSILLSLLSLSCLFYISLSLRTPPPLSLLILYSCVFHTTLSPLPLFSAPLYLPAPSLTLLFSLFLYFSQPPTSSLSFFNAFPPSYTACLYLFLLFYSSFSACPLLRLSLSLCLVLCLCLYLSPPLSFFLCLSLYDFICISDRRSHQN